MATLRANCSKVLAIGRNYADHITELKNVRPKQPFFFIKPRSSILIPNAGPVLRPRGVSLHYEVELGLVMNRDLTDLPIPSSSDTASPSSSTDESITKVAMDAISGYFIGIDMTARNVQDEAKKKGLPWSTAKGFDTFTVISNFIPKHKIPDPHEVELYLSVNNEVRQQDSTNLMLFRIPRILGHISQIMTIEEGDLVLTGTPKGVGEVGIGDVMRAGVRVGGEEVEEGRIEVGVEEREGPYVFTAT